MSKITTLSMEDLMKENSEVFNKELQSVINPSFTGLENPKKYKNLLQNTLEQSKRSSLLRQSRLVASATEYLESKKNKSLIISAEMGSGKCILPDSNVIIDGQVYIIEEAYKLFADKESVVIDDENPFAFWYQTNQKLTVPSYDETSRTFVEKKVKHIYKQKVSETIREVKTAGKYTLKTTKVHKYLTPDGWTNNINVGDYVAIPKNEQIIGEKQNIMNPQLLAWLLGEGYFSCQNTRLDKKDSGHSIRVTQKDKVVAEKIYDMAVAESKYSVTKRVDKRDGMNEIGIYKVQSLLPYLKWGVSKDKEIPDFLMKSTKEDIVKFLAAYIDAEGSISKDSKGTVEISTASKKMAYQLSSLLRKVNVISSIEEMQKCATNGKKIMRTYYRISISGSSVRTLSTLIVPHSIVDYKKERLLDISKRVVNNNIETIYMFDIIKQLRELTGLSRAKSNNIFANVYLNGLQKTVNTKRAYEIIELIDSVINGTKKIDKEVQIDKLSFLKDEVLLRISQEIFYVLVKEVREYQYDGYVYDLSIEDTHNFIAENMLVHNTDMAIKISMSEKLIPVYFVVCPPHLIDTWKEELRDNYKNPNAYKAIVINRWEDLTKYTKRNLWNDGVKYYFLIKRESLKLSYPKEVAVNIKKKYVSVEKELDGQTHMFRQLIDVATCPCCGNVILEEEDNFLDLKKIPRVCEGSIRTYRKDAEGEDEYIPCGNILRQVDRKVSLKMRTREAIADYVFKNFSKGSYNVILDEMHEYKGGNTGQGNAMARIVSNAKKTIGLTGTLMNGYASSLFYILYRLNPSLMKKELKFDYEQVKSFVSKYGAHEETFEAAEVSVEGVVTKMGRRIALKEKPKVSPHLLSVLLGMTIFLRLDEIKMPNNLQLPDYEEQIVLVPMEEDLKTPYMDYIKKITAEIKQDRRLLGNLANDALAIPDMPFTPRSAQDKIFYDPEYSREDFGTTAKEKRLVELVKQETKDNRGCLVYLTHTNQQVAPDIEALLTKEIPNKVVLFLPATVATAKRKAWINSHPCDVLICNPELVKTGLTLLEFPSIIFYQTTYNVFTLKQASRRSWRIGQKKDVRVFFMAYEATPQHKALELIGAKVAAANSLEGRLSGDEDLSSLGDDNDNLQLALAKAILNGDSASKNIEMTSITNFGGDREFDTFELYYQELLDEHKKNEHKAIQAELIETATKNEEEGISTHDGYGGNWGKGLADIFEISNNSNIEICSMPKVETKKSSDITLENMIDTFATKVLEHHNSGELLGGKVSNSGVTSYLGAFQLFEINDAYRENKVNGITALYRRDDENKVVSVELNSVYYEGNTSFKHEKVLLKLGIKILNFAIEGCAGDSKKLAKVILGHISNKKMPVTKATPTEVLVDSPVSVVAIVGKGRKQKVVEVKASNNLLDSGSENITGAQLAFAF